MTISDHVARYVAIKQHLGYEFTTNAEILSNFARFADARDEPFLRADTALQWAVTAPSRDRCVKKLQIVHALATWLYAEDTRHEVPRRDAFGSRSCRMSAAVIARRLLPGVGLDPHRDHPGPRTLRQAHDTSPAEKGHLAAHPPKRLAAHPQSVESHSGAGKHLLIPRDPNGYRRSTPPHVRAKARTLWSIRFRYAYGDDQRNKNT